MNVLITVTVGPVSVDVLVLDTLSVDVDEGSVVVMLSLAEETEEVDDESVLLLLLVVESVDEVSLDVVVG